MYRIGLQIFSIAFLRKRLFISAYKKQRGKYNDIVDILQLNIFKSKLDTNWNC